MASIAALASACALRLVVGDVTAVDASLRTEARARRGGAEANELQTEPRVGLSLAAGRLSLGASYSPWLLLEGTSLDRLVVLHRVSLATHWRGARGLKLQATAQGSYGRNDFLAVQPPGAIGDPNTVPVQPIPRLTTLPYMDAELDLQAEGMLAARQRGRLGLAFFTSGGATGEARAYLPLQRGGRIGVAHSWTFAAREVLESELTGTVTDFAAGPVAMVGMAGLTWRHGSAPGGQVWAGAGAAATRSGRRSEGPVVSELVPTAAAGLQGPLRGRLLEGAVALSLAPFIDRVSGAAYQRVELSASAQLRPSSRWTLSAIASGGRGLSGAQAGDLVAVADVRATWAAARWIGVAAGVRGLWQRQPTSVPASTREVGLFVSIEVHDRWRL